MRWRRPILPALLLAAALAPGAAAAPGNGLIAYHEADEAGAFQLWVVGSDGNGRHQITSGEDCGGCASLVPAWAPDGERLYFGLELDGSNIYSMRLDGSDRQQVTTGPPAAQGYPSVSPGGGRIAYHAEDDFEQGLYVAQIDGSGAHRVASLGFGGPGFGFDANPDFGPHGQIAFVHTRLINCEDLTPFSHGCRPGREHGFGGSIWLVKADGTGLRRLTDPGRVWSDPQWSPDGSRLLLQSYDEGGKLHGYSADLFVMNADGSGLRPLTRTREGEFAFSPDWSPDGERIVFHHAAAADDHIELWTMRADGSDPAPLAPCSPLTFCDFATWGPLPAAG